jgi:hypothetical protein
LEESITALVLGGPAFFCGKRSAGKYEEHR